MFVCSSVQSNKTWGVLETKLPKIICRPALVILVHTLCPEELHLTGVHVCDVEF